MMKNALTFILAILLAFSVSYFGVKADESIITIKSLHPSYNNASSFYLEGVIDYSPATLKINGSNIELSNHFRALTELVQENYKSTVELNLINEKNEVIETIKYELFHKKIVEIYLESSEIVFEGETQKLYPQIQFIDGHSMVPLRQIVENFGAVTYWNHQTKTIGLSFRGKSIELQIGQKYITVDGEKKEIDAPAIIFENRTIVSLRFFEAAFDALIRLDSPEMIFKIEFDGHPTIVTNTRTENSTKITGYKMDINSQYTHCHMSGNIPQNHHVAVNGEKGSNHYTFAHKGQLNPAPSFTEVNLELFDADGRMIESNQMRIENIKLTTYKLSSKKSEMIVADETYPLEHPIKILEEMAFIPFSSISQIFEISDMEKEDDSISFIFQNQEITFEADSDGAMINSHPLTLPHDPKIFDNQMYISSESVGLLFGVKTKYLRGTKSVVIVKEIHPEV